MGIKVPEAKALAKPRKKDESTEVKATPVPVTTKKVLAIHSESPPPSVAGIIEEVLLGRNERVHYFRPSMISGCGRANYYHFQKAPESPPNTPPILHRILDTGTALHGMLQEYLSTHKDVFFAPEVKVYDPDLFVKGSCDGMLIERKTGYRWILEIKTIGDKGFKALSGPKPEHCEQATIYMALLGVRWCSFLYLNKNTAAVREFPYEFNDALWESLKERLTDLRGCVEEGRTPPFSSRECVGSIDLCRYVGHCQAERGIETEDDE